MLALPNASISRVDGPCVHMHLRKQTRPHPMDTSKWGCRGCVCVYFLKQQTIFLPYFLLVVPGPSCNPLRLLKSIPANITPSSYVHACVCVLRSIEARWRSNNSSKKSVWTTTLRQTVWRAHPTTETVGKPSRSPLRLPPTSLSGPSPARNTRSSRSLFLCPAFAFNRHLMFSYALHLLLHFYSSLASLYLFLEKLWTAQTGRHQTNTNDSSLSTAREVVGRRKGGKWGDLWLETVVRSSVSSCFNALLAYPPFPHAHTHTHAPHGTPRERSDGVQVGFFWSITA